MSPASALLGRLGATSRFIRWSSVGKQPSWQTVDDVLTAEHIRAHYEGREVIGCPPAAYGVARFAAIDIDLHVHHEPTKAEIATVEGYAHRKLNELEASGVKALLVRSHLAGSFHLFFFVRPMVAASLGRWLKQFVADADGVGTGVDVFPPPSGAGGSIRIPGRHHRRTKEWSAAWNGSTWLSWPAAFDMLVSLPENDPRLFPDPGQPKEPAAPATCGTRPGDLFNAKNPPEKVLMDRGWHTPREDGDRLFLTRPGKADGNSAAIKDGTAWIYTGSVAGLIPSTTTGKPYDSFSLLTHLDFKGDFAAAARALAKQGYSSPKPAPSNQGSETSGTVQPHKPRYVPIPAYEPFPTDCLPAPWADFVRQGAAALKCDEALVALPLLSVLAAAIGTSRRVHLGAEWYEPSVLWSCIVAESGSCKSPAAELSVDLVQARQKKQMKEYREEMKRFKDELAKRKEAKPEDRDDLPPEKPQLERSLVSDVTIEKLVGILGDNPRGVLLYRDELQGWVNSFSKYKSSGGASDEGNWLSIHRAGAISYDRKTGDRTTIYVPFGAASVTGGIQPGTLARIMTTGFFESGLVARILFCMPPRTPKTWSDDGISDAVKAAASKSLDALYALNHDYDEEGEPKPVVLTLSPPAKARMKRFVNEWGLRQFNAEGAEAAALAKLEAFPGRFALIHHCVLKAGTLEDNDPISLESLEAGITLTEWFAREADRVYRMLRESEVEKDTRKLVELVTRLAGRNEGRVSEKVLQKSNNRRYPDKAAATLALESLINLGLGRWVDGDASRAGGRKVRYFEFTSPATADAEKPESGSCTTHDVSDDRSDDDLGGLHDDHSDPPSDQPPSSTGSNDVNGYPESTSSDISEYAENRSSETSCVVQDREPGNRGAGAELAPEANVVQCSPSHLTPEQSGCPYTLVTTPAGLSDVVTAIEDGGGMIGLDTETTGLDHATDRVRLIQLATARGTFIIDVFAFADPSEAFTELFEVLAKFGIVGHHLGFDLPFLVRLGFVPGRVFDSMLASQVLHAGDTGARHGLKDVAARVLGREVDKTEQKADWSKPLTPEMLRYAALDAELPLQIREKLLPELEVAKLTPTIEAENNALACVAWASRQGIGFDRPAWEALAREAEQRQDQLREHLDTAAPNAGTLTSTRNWDSPNDVKEAFASVGVKIEATDDDTLAGVNHPLATLMREYRSAAKLASTYGFAWLEHVNPNGRVYANWRQIGAGASGRMSCKEPNLQQLPRDPRYRRCFVAPPGRVLVKTDYSQIELRIAAKITGDRRMSEAYRNGEDIHTLTARALLGKQDVTKADRQLAKAVNFGLLYGQGARGLMAYALGSYGVHLTEAEATAHRNTFFKTYPGLRKWHNSIGRTPIDTRTLAGRRRLAVERYTEKLNTPVQGSGADGLKLALALLWERREQCPGAFPVLFVHDEIVVECDEVQADTATAWVRAAMLDAMTPLIAPVPVEVETTVGKTWGG